MALYFGLDLLRSRAEKLFLEQRRFQVFEFIS